MSGQIRGPKVNADVSFYFGIDGKAEFRTMDTLDQAWVLGRHAHEYRDADAVEVTRLVGMMLIAYVHQHLRRPDLPFGGYYPLGVCQDGVAAIERKMTGHDTLFPNTTEAALWDDPRDAEINEMMIAIPKDRNGAPPAPERIFGSLPVTDFRLITIPGLAADLGGGACGVAGWIAGADAIVDGEDEVAACCCGRAGGAGWSRGMETKASEEVIAAGRCSDATHSWVKASYTRGRIAMATKKAAKKSIKKAASKKTAAKKSSSTREVQSIGGQGCRARDEGDEAGQAEERPQRKESDEPKAGDCDWIVRGAQGRQEGSSAPKK